VGKGVTLQGNSYLPLEVAPDTDLGYYRMKKLFVVLFAIVTMGLVSCGNGSENSSSSQASGGRKSSSQVPVTLDELDDYFTVKSYKLETNVADKGLEHLADAKGTLTLVLKRNKEEMKLKPSDIEWAEVAGSTNETSYKVFQADIDGVARKLVKLEPGDEETVEISVKIIDPYMEYFSSDEENQKRRQAHYDALTGVKGALSEIYFEVSLKDEDD
jgi:hypothetical protein